MEWKKPSNFKIKKKRFFDKFQMLRKNLTALISVTMREIAMHNLLKSVWRISYFLMRVRQTWTKFLSKFSRYQQAESFILME